MKNRKRKEIKKKQDISIFLCSMALMKNTCISYSSGFRELLKVSLRYLRLQISHLQTSLVKMNY